MTSPVVLSDPSELPLISYDAAIKGLGYLTDSDHEVREDYVDVRDILRRPVDDETKKAMLQRVDSYFV